jgi:hypothetical protein
MNRMDGFDRIQNHHHKILLADDPYAASENNRSILSQGSFPSSR